MALITYKDKVSLVENPDIADENKVTAQDMNEIKKVVNENQSLTYDSLPVGSILPYSSSTVPIGYLLCDGSLISRTEYSGLFNVIGTSYNLETDTDDTKFRLPNLKGRVPVGLDNEDTDFNTLGKTGGSKYLQKHSHVLTMFNQYADGTGGHYATSKKVGKTTDGADGGSSCDGVSITGTGDSGNLQPYIVTNYIIKASGTAVLKGNVVDNLTDNSTENAPSQRAVNEEFSNVKGKILWTNPNPTNSINTLSMTLENSDYDELEIFYQQSTSDSRCYSQKILKGYNGRIYLPYNVSGSYIPIYRNVDRNTDTSYTIGNITGFSDTSAIIPLYVIGYKTGLFS